MLSQNCGLPPPEFSVARNSSSALASAMASALANAAIVAPLRKTDEL
jgi:hypothetical protein